MTFGAARVFLAAAVLAELLSACGGGGSSSAAASRANGDVPGNAAVYQPGVFKPASNFAQRCAAPRSGTADVQGTLTDENNWLRSWTNDLYLWFSEVPDLDPSLYSSKLTYFSALKTPATTASGAPKDKFHFTYSTDVWKQMSESGQSAGYGAEFSLISATPPRQVVVAYTNPNTPATTAPANLARGAQIVTVDGVDVATSTDTDTLNGGLFPTSAGETHVFGVRDLNSSTTRTVTLTSAIVTSMPVQNVGTFNIGGGKVGYMLFNDHLATAEPALIQAFTSLSNAGATDLVLDIRYNGGGYLDIASEVAYMIAGTRTTGKHFETTQFNSRHPTVDPVTSQTITPLEFHSTAQGFSTSVSQGSPLPTLNLSRVFVLTGPDTCSASESIINSLRGIDVQVIQIGRTTCGKPYGFYPQDNCGTTYFSIEFRGVNNAGYGDYTDGFQPGTETASNLSVVAGCQVADDFTHALGDTAEARFGAALQYRANGSCPAVSLNGGALQKAAARPNLAAIDGTVPKTPWLENRILRH